MPFEDYFAAEEMSPRKKPRTQAEPLYYIQNTGITPCGNCVFWWRVGGHGYTYNLDEAWKVPLKKAKEICSSRDEQDKYFAVEAIDKLAQRHVDFQLMRGLK